MTRLVALVVLGLLWLGHASAQVGQFGYTIERSSSGELFDWSDASEHCLLIFDVEGADDIEIKVRKAGQWDTVTFVLEIPLDRNRLIKVGEKSRWLTRSCNYRRTFHTNDLIAEQWAPRKEWFERALGFSCLGKGAEAVGEALDAPHDSKVLLLQRGSAKGDRVMKACEKLAGLRRNVQCRLGNDPSSTLCNERFQSAGHPGRLLTHEESLLALLRGEELEARGFVETEEGRTARLEREQKQAQERQALQEARQRQEEERQRQARQREEREAWLRTPEGRKYLAEEEARRKRAENESRSRQAKFAAEFPLVAVVTCAFSGRHMNIYACFAGRVGTEIELRNGASYGLYKVHELDSIGDETADGFTIDLRSRFSLTLQNSSENLTLGVKVMDRKTRSVLYQKQVSRFGVIHVQND